MMPGCAANLWKNKVDSARPYNTAANYHRVVDIVSAAARVCFVHFGLQRMETFISKKIQWPKKL